MPKNNQPKSQPSARPEPYGDTPAVPKVEQPDPKSPQFQEEVREEIEKEKLDP